MQQYFQAISGEQLTTLEGPLSSSVHIFFDNSYGIVVVHYIVSYIYAPSKFCRTVVTHKALYASGSL